jgi:hypothetical protein
MKGASSTPASKNNADPYPGLDAILKKSRKIKPFSNTDAEQRLRALHELVPTGVLRPGVADMVDRMEKDYARAVSNWRADNWLLPTDKESEFPYSRTRNLVTPMVKYGAAWLPAKDWDAGHPYDSEGESIGFSQYLENIRRAGLIEASDLSIKGIATVPEDEKDPVLKKMQGENVTIRETFMNTHFNRYDEVWKSYSIAGYTITNRFRAFKLFSKQQQKLLETYESTPTRESKKALLDHVNQHGELVNNIPKPDPPARREVPPPPPKKSKKGAKTIIGNATDV